MGMFLSQFSMLKALGYGEHGIIQDETEKLLEPYKLFVLVLHDPGKHTSFHHKFSQLFERLDYLTGRNLLFMGIAKPSYDWYSRNKDRDYFGIWEKEQLLRSLHEIKGVDGSISCYSIAKALDIDYDDIPCLLISPDFESKHFVFLKTGEKHIESQLMELGVFTGSVNERRAFIFSDSFKSLLRNIDYYGEMEFVKHHEVLGASLADIFSFSVPENNHFGRDAKMHSNSVINKLAIKINELNDPQEIENTKMSLLVNLANKFKNSTRPLEGESGINAVAEPSDIGKGAKNTEKILFDLPPLYKPRVNYVSGAFSYLNDHIVLFEPETKIIISTTQYVYQMFEEIPSNKSLDFSPLVLGFSKIFEMEVNLSVVHWVRKYLKIKMPDYYKKFSPECLEATIIPDESIVPNPKKIDFNMHKGLKWIAPGIGQSELVIRSLFKNDLLIESFSQKEESGLLDVWTPIREMRNRAAHNEIMRSEDLEKIAINLTSLSTSRNFKKILDLKQQYKGITKENND